MITFANFLVHIFPFHSSRFCTNISSSHLLFLMSFFVMCKFSFFRLLPFSHPSFSFLIYIDFFKMSQAPICGRYIVQTLSGCWGTIRNGNGECMGRVDHPQIRSARYFCHLIPPHNCLKRWVEQFHLLFIEAHHRSAALLAPMILPTVPFIFYYFLCF